MSVFTTIGNGFYVNSTGPVDARFVVADSASRKTQFDGVYFEGLIVYQQDTQEIYVCVSAPNGVANLDTDWELVYPASGSTSDTGSLITASVAGNVIEFEKANGDLFTITVDTGSFDTSSLLITGSVNQNVLTFKKGNGDEFTLTVDTGSGGDAFPFTGSAEITGSLVITGSLDTTGSVKLALDTSSTAVDNVMMYDSQSGQVFFTSSAAIGGSSVIYTGEVVTTPQTIQKIKTLDFGDDETLVQFDTNDGELKFIFGIPPTPSANASTNLYNADRFNLQPQDFTVSGTYNKQANEFISASLKEILPSASLLATRQFEPPPGTTPLTYNMVSRTGSKAGTRVAGFYGGAIEYKFQMELTSSSPIDGSEQIVTDPTTLSLNKVPPVVPTITHVLDAQRVIGSTTIEVGATGSFNYTASSNSNPQSGTSPRESNNFRYLQMVDDSSPSMDVLSPEGSSFGSISGSIDLEDYSISQSFLVKVEAQYDSNNGQPGDFALNDPNLPVERSPSTRGYNRVRSVRAASFFTFDTGSILENLDNLSLFETGFTSTGGKYFYTETSNGDPQNVTIEIERQNNCCDIIVIDETYTLTQINTPLGDALSSFTMETINGWRIYKTGTLAETTAPAEYVLKR